MSVCLSLALFYGGNSILVLLEAAVHRTGIAGKNQLDLPDSYQAVNVIQPIASYS